MKNSFLNLNSILESDHSMHSLQELFARPTNELYLCSALHEVEKFNSEVNELNLKNFKSILEAETKSEENNQFCTYFTEFKCIIDRFVDKTRQMASKTIINIDNLADANKELIEDDNLLMNHIPFEMGLCKYRNLTNKEVPKFKARYFFKKDFDHIGTLMQDLGPVASDDAKLKIIASVYNSLKIEMEDDFLEKCAEKMLDDEYDKSLSMPEQVNKLFKDGKENKTIEKTDVQEARSVMLNIGVYIDAINCMAEDIAKDFYEIANSLGNMVFSNKSCTLKIDTGTDGVRNTEYELNTYSMNQFNLFMRTKSIQVSQMCNMYMVAFSIKLDNIIEFISQNKEILTMANAAINPPKYEDDGDEGEEAIDGSVSDDIMAPDAPAAEEPDDDLDGVPDDDDDDNPDDEPEDDTPAEEPVEEAPEVDTPAEKELKEESYYFEYQRFNLERLFEQELIREEYQRILEADGDNTTSTPNTSSMSNANSSKAVDIWRSILEKLTELFNKFLDIFVKQTTRKIKYLNDNKKEIMSGEFGKGTTIRGYNSDNLRDLTIKDLNYESMKASLANKDTYIKDHYDNIKGKTDVNFSQAIKNHILPDAVNEQPIDEVTTKEKMFAFCTSEYQTMVNQIKTDKNVINKAQQNAMRMAKFINKPTPEPAPANNNDNDANTGGTADNNQQAKTEGVMTADYLYFNEFTNKNEDKNTKAELMVYFSVSSQVLSNKMSLANAIFNEFYRALTSLVANNQQAPKEKAPKEEYKK